MPLSLAKEHVATVTLHSSLNVSNISFIFGRSESFLLSFETLISNVVFEEILDFNLPIVFVSLD
jgi:hypothetical protein